MATTLLLRRPGGHTEPSKFRLPCSGGKGGETYNFFSLWENTLNLTTCSGCNVPVKLAKKKKEKKKQKERKISQRSGVLLNTDNQNNNLDKKKKNESKETICHDSLSVFSYGRAVFCSQRVSRRRTGPLATGSLPVEPREPCHPTVHCASNTKLTHHQLSLSNIYLWKTVKSM